MGIKHPKACNYVLDHLVELEALYDVCIVAGFSMGLSKAMLVATSGPMLGDNVGRHGRTPNGERVQGVWDFAPLKNLKQLQQFMGCCNWLCTYMVPLYSQIIKVLGPFLKEDAVYPPEGLGPGSSAADKAVRGLKLLAKYYIEMGCLDEVAAINGTRPLEQIADSSGIAWGGMCIQMTPDMGGFVVLCAAGKSLTASQQAWDPLSLEGFAQLQVKRHQNKVIGRMRSKCWTDHANWTRQGDKVDIEVKHLRWYSEIVSDGSEVRSLSGRTATLGDGISRNPIDRDAVLEQRSRDLSNLAGKIRGFNMEEFLSDWEDPGQPVPWTIGEHALPNPILSSMPGSSTDRPVTTPVNAERETVPQGAAPLLVPIAAVPPGSLRYPFLPYIMTLYLPPLVTKEQSR